MNAITFALFLIDDFKNNPINASEEHSGIDSTQINNRDAFKINSLGYKSVSKIRS